ncbi:MAG: hypothetical protein J6C42_11670, partial [Clostridia bacterium]|nr:hypothetical protein [Clostridia bacterium]
MKKLLIFLLMLLPVLLSACGKTEEIPEETEAAMETEAETAGMSAGTETLAPETLRYVSLGDSIARGYGLTNPKTEAYSSVLAASVKESGKTMVSRNFGVDGQDSTQLAAYILNNSAIPEELADADYVSISIGANNFLGDAFDFLGTCQDFKTNPSTR